MIISFEEVISKQITKRNNLWYNILWKCNLFPTNAFTLWPAINWITMMQETIHSQSFLRMTNNMGNLCFSKSVVQLLSMTEIRVPVHWCSGWSSSSCQWTESHCCHWYISPWTYHHHQAHCLAAWQSTCSSGVWWFLV